ncbi:MAG: aminopeptidase [Acidobacteriota bacterium]
MTDPRYQQLAKNLVHYSCALEPGEKVLIEAIDIPEAFTLELIRTVGAAGAIPVVTLKSQAVWRALMLAASAEQMQLIGETEAHRMKQVQAYIGVRGNPNIAEWSDVPKDKMNLYNDLCWRPVHLDIRIKEHRWVVLRWPSPSMAQLANCSTEAFEDFYFRVCNLDYSRMAKAMEPLVELMERTDRVRLVAPGTDLRFSIRDIPAIPCDGRANIPDGEVFTAPVRDSIAGTIQFNSPTIYQGVAHNDIRLEFENGRIVAASSNDTAHLEQVLDTDEGSRYVGEFAIGFNPHITTPMRDILFDEKIAGSIHLTPGNAYEEAFNGNRSQIHWDLVLRMDPQVGGGEIWFDDRLIRKDGQFVIDELLDLNPDRLLAGC